MRLLLILSFVFFVPLTAHAGAVKCKKLGVGGPDYYVYESGRCPVGMIALGPVESTGRPNLRFSDSLHQSIRDYGESTRPLAQSTGNSIANLLGSRPVQGKSAAQKKIETIQLIDSLVASGSISEKQGQKLKSEAINH